MEYYAHIRKNSDNQSAVQTVAEHLHGTAECARKDLEGCGLGQTAYLAGLLHDMGKYTETFQSYLQEGDPDQRGTVIHSFQGCQYAMEHWHKSENINAAATAELIAYAVGAHHGQFDCVDKTGKIGLQYRRDKEDIGYAEASAEFLLQCISEQALSELFEKSLQEITEAVSTIEDRYQDDREYTFQIGMLARLLLSAVIDGDRTDTAEFMENRTHTPCRENMRNIWAQTLSHIETKLDEFPTDTPVQKARREISEQCKAFASQPRDIYRLNVPTGGGKTLSSLRFALAHAGIHGHKRIIFTSPLLSILEQNAKVIHDFIENDSLILEHHSNVVHEKSSMDAMDERELWVQNWDAPIIITTMVQLLNTLFSGKTTAIRRFQSLCDSIIVIDEVQTVPARLLSLFNQAIRFLQEQCGATIVLCSATQPCLAETDHPLPKVPADIVPYDSQLWAAFSRTAIDTLGNARLKDLPAIVEMHMGSVQSLLVICNTKSEAQTLLNSTLSSDWVSFHLSASMCMQHRRNTVAALKDTLASGQKVLCISTQVIEAGVDVSFERVIRLLAGMDSVVQAAGRCNRNGESQTLCPVYMIDCTDERLGMLRDILRGKQAAQSLIYAFRSSPDSFGGDYASYSAIEYFYKAFYRSLNSGEQDFFVDEVQSSIFELLSTNADFADCAEAESYFLWQAFKTAGQYFRVFDDNTADILVPYGRGAEIISQLNSRRATADADYRSTLLKEASSYSVSLYEYQKKRLESLGAIVPICSGAILTLDAAFYDNISGLVTESGKQSFLEV